MTTDCRLPRAARLRDDKEIAAFRMAASARGRWFLVRLVPNELGHARVLIRVAKRFIRASTDRNWVKRCVREVFRHKRTELPHCDYLVAVVNRYSEPSLAAARNELERMLSTSAKPQ